MLQNFRRAAGMCLLLTGGMLTEGCYKNHTVLPETGVAVTRTVSFSGDIIPIFNKSCNNSGCHSAGAIAPNLMPASAFNALNGGNYIDKNKPENSSLYLWMTGKKSSPMPLSGPDKEYNALILAWIKQGALNN